MSIAEGRIFVSREALKRAIEDWMVQDKFATRQHRNDAQGLDVRCKQKASGCTWRVYASQKIDHSMEVRNVQPVHNCLGGQLPKGYAVNTQNWLLRVVPTLLVVRHDTPPQAIIDAIKAHYSMLLFLFLYFFNCFTERVLISVQRRR
jgi:hypothetical protein